MRAPGDCLSSMHDEVKEEEWMGWMVTIIVSKSYGFCKIYG